LALTGDLTRGIPLLDEAVRAFHPTRSDSSPVVFLGEAHLLAGHDAEAQTLAVQAIALTRDRGERGLEAWALRLQADSAGREAPAVAAVAYDRALALAVELGMEPLAGHCHLGRGRLRRQIGDRQRARADLSAAVERFRSTNMSPWLAAAAADLASAERD